MTNHQLEVKVNIWSATSNCLMVGMLWEEKNLTASSLEKFLLR